MVIQLSGAKCLPENNWGGRFSYATVLPCMPPDFYRYCWMYTKRPELVNKSGLLTKSLNKEKPTICEFPSTKQSLALTVFDFYRNWCNFWGSWTNAACQTTSDQLKGRTVTLTNDRYHIQQIRVHAPLDYFVSHGSILTILRNMLSRHISHM